MEASTRVDTNDLLTALRHPLRRQILQTMAAGPQPLSPRELAGTLEQPLSNVSYHPCERPARHHPRPSTFTSWRPTAGEAQTTM